MFDQTDDRSDSQRPKTPDWARANLHPVRKRVSALYLQADEPLSPKDITVKLFGKNHHQRVLGRVAYHVRELVKLNVLELVKKADVRGTVKTFYRPTKAARLDGYALLDEVALVLNDHAERGDSDSHETLGSIAALLRSSGRSVAELGA